MASDENLTRRVDEMRLAADRLRAGDESLILDKEFLSLVADMLDMEAATLGEIVPFTEMLDAAISNQTGGSARLVLARDVDGELMCYTDNTDAASRIADYIKGK